VQQDPGAKSLKYEWEWGEQNGFVVEKEKKNEPYLRHLNSDCFLAPDVLWLFLSIHLANISCRASEIRKHIKSAK